MSTTKETIGPRGTVPGFRPLIGSERWLFEDYKQRHLKGGTRPLLYRENGVTHGMLYPVTRKPLPPPQVETFESHGHVWYRHVPGDPCPVEDDARITVIYSGGQQSSLLSNPDEWNWGKMNSQNTEIIGYRFPDYPAVHTRLQKQQASAEPVEKTQQSFQPRLSDEEARDLAMVRFIRAHMNEEMETYTIWDAAWQAAKLHYTAKCSLPAASADSLPTPAA